LGKRAFAYYNVDIKDWYVEDGEFEILVGGCSQCTPLKAVVTVKSTAVIDKIYTKNSTPGEIMADPIGKAIIEDMMSKSPISIGGHETSEGMLEMVYGMPLRSITMFSPDQFNEEKMNVLLEKMNS
jgi:beta-glucosidase